jgi:hypothetical protein
VEPPCSRATLAHAIAVGASRKRGARDRLIVGTSAQSRTLIFQVGTPALRR